MSSPTDQQLIQYIGQGRRDALAQLFDRYSADLYDYLARLVGDRDQAARLLDQVMLRVPGAAAGFQPRDSVRGWLYSIARESGLDWLRQRGWLDGLPPSDETIPPGLQGDVWKAARAMPGFFRAVLITEELQPLSPTEKARALGVNRTDLARLIDEARKSFNRIYDAQARAEGRPTSDRINTDTVWNARRRFPVEGGSLFGFLPQIEFPESLKQQIRKHVVEAMTPPPTGRPDGAELAGAAVLASTLNNPPATEAAAATLVAQPAPVAAAPVPPASNNTIAGLPLTAVGGLVGVALALLICAGVYLLTQNRSVPSFTSVQPVNGTAVPIAPEIIVFAEYRSERPIDSTKSSFQIDGAGYEFQLINSNTIAWRGPLGLGLHNVAVEIVDSANNSAEETWSFTVLPAGMPDSLANATATAAAATVIAAGGPENATATAAANATSIAATVLAAGGPANATATSAAATVSAAGGPANATASSAAATVSAAGGPANATATSAAATVIAAGGSANATATSAAATVIAAGGPENATATAAASATSMAATVIAAGGPANATATSAAATVIAAGGPINATATSVAATVIAAGGPANATATAAAGGIATVTPIAPVNTSVLTITPIIVPGTPTFQVFTPFPTATFSFPTFPPPPPPTGCNRGGVSGIAFNDLNGNGIRDPNEPGLSGVTLNLSTQLNSIIAVTISDTFGNYRFTDIPFSNYRVSANTPPGWFATTSTSIPVFIGGCGIVPGFNFGFVQAPVITITPTRTWTPPTSFAVIDVTANVFPLSSNVCPTQFNFNGTITTNSAGVVTYQWIRPDGFREPLRQMNFNSGGTQSVPTFTWTYNASISGIGVLEVSSPNFRTASTPTLFLNCSLPPPTTLTPTATATWTPTTPPVSVTNVVAQVSPTSSTTCPDTFTFTGTVTVNGATNVLYRWVRSDGSQGSDQVLSFLGPGTQNVAPYPWTLGEPGFNFNGWALIRILSPNSLDSNQAGFQLNCPPPTLSPTPTPSDTPVPPSMASATVDPASPNPLLACPGNVTFTGQITVTGPTVVNYEWEQSDGATFPQVAIIFAGPGSAPAVGHNWNFPAPIDAANLWARINITSPNITSSGQALFDVDCIP